MRFIVCLLCLLPIGFIACDWNHWANGNNGVHGRPVFTAQPLIDWSFRPPVPSTIKGIINIDDSTGNIIVPNSASSQPLFWVLDKTGNVVYSFNDTEPGSCSGTLTVENSIVYVFNELTCKTMAVDLTNQTLLWTSSRMCRRDNTLPVVGPITIMTGNLVVVPFTYGFGTVYKADGSYAAFYSSASEPAQFFLPTYSTTTAQTLMYWPTSRLTQPGWSVMVSVNPYNDTNMTPILVDQANGDIYATLNIGAVAKISFKGEIQWKAEFLPFQPDYTKIQHGLVLIDRTYVIVMANDTFYAINATNGEYNPVNIDQVTLTQVKAQLLYSNNVLYATDGPGNLAAYDVTDRLSWKHLWTVNTGTKFIMGAGPSIGLDGTIYVASASGDEDTSTLIALSCPEVKNINGVSTCVRCAVGKYFNATAGCVLCGDGLVPNVNRTACEECPENEFSMSGDDTCTACSEQPDNAQCPPPPVPPPTPVPTSESPRSEPLATTSGATLLFSALPLMCNYLLSLLL